MTPESIKRLANLLSELPSLGPRQATRLAFHIAGLDKQTVEDIIETLKSVAKVKRCTHCFVLDELSNGLPAQAGLCTICRSPRRNQALIAIVEKETDAHTLEKTHAFTGRYLVLGELPKDGILNSQHKQRLQALKHFIEDLPNAQAEEIILALSPTTYGDVNASVLAGALRALTPKITRLARGIPTGGEIEFADEQTLGEALKHRD